MARNTWILKNERNEELDYKHFGPPLLLTVDKILGRMRSGCGGQEIQPHQINYRTFDQRENLRLARSDTECGKPAIKIDSLADPLDLLRPPQVRAYLNGESSATPHVISN